MENRLRKRHGFNMLEVLITVAVIAIVAGLGFPLFQNVVYRTQVRGEIRQLAFVFQKARLEAIRRGAPAVVSLDVDDGEVFAFVDVHGASAADPSDGLFNPVDAPYRSTDYEVQRVKIAAGMVIEEPGGSTGVDAVDGFDNPAPLPDRVAIYRPDGSVDAAGAMRFMDRRANYFEVRVAPAATGKIQVRKWDDTLNVNWDGTHWYAEGEVSKAWNWN